VSPTAAAAPVLLVTLALLLLVAAVLDRGILGLLLLLVLREAMAIVSARLITVVLRIVTVMVIEVRLPVEAAPHTIAVDLGRVSHPIVSVGLVPKPPKRVPVQ